MPPTPHVPPPRLYHFAFCLSLIFYVFHLSIHMYTKSRFLIDYVSLPYIMDGITDVLSFILLSHNSPDTFCQSIYPARILWITFLSIPWVSVTEEPTYVNSIATFSLYLSSLITSSNHTVASPPNHRYCVLCSQT